MPHVDSNGVSLHYEVSGEGPPLLLVAGLGGNRNSWLAVLPELASRHRVIVFDNRGTGQSDVPDGPYSMDELAADTAGLIDALGTGPIPAVGWSMGGIILQAMLLDWPDRLSAAVLLSTLPSYTAAQHPWLDAVLALREAGVDPVAVGAIGAAWTFTPYYLTDHDRLRHMLELGAKDPEPTSYKGFAAQAAGIRVFDRRAELPRVTTPTHVLVGAEDVLTPPSQSAEIASLIPGATLEILPRGGHAMIVEYPAATLRAIEGFLDRTAAGAG